MSIANAAEPWQREGALDSICLQFPHIVTALQVCLEPYVDAKKVRSVFVFGPGQGYELTQIRRLFPHASIHGFDTTEDECQQMNLAGYGSLTGTHIHAVDFRDVDAVSRVVKHLPDLVICRSPEILVNAKEGIVDYCMVEAIAEWAARLVSEGKQMFLTFLTMQEAELVVREMKRRGIPFESNQNYSVNQKAFLTTRGIWKGHTEDILSVPDFVYMRIPAEG